jgi:Zn-dependent protease
MMDTIDKALTLIIPMVIAIVFHEVAHGWTARALGDPTASQLKRLSLNPLRHVDPVGTVLVPGVLKLMGFPVFGWAKPVPVVKERLRNPRRDMMLVAAAGPASNLAMGLIGAVLLGLLLRLSPQDQAMGGISGFVAQNLINFLLINVFLALFNLIPIPPFDGSHIVEGLLSPGAAQSYEKLRPMGFPLMLILLVVLPTISPSLNVVTWLVWPPVSWLTEHYFNLAAIVGGA